jgi:hypothetical protein
MAIPLKLSTASQEVPLGYFVDSTDGNTEETALTIANTDIKLWKAGATTLANKNSGGATHISNGIYYAVLDATDTNTLGPLVIFVHVAGALAVRVECVVYPANIYDSLIAGTDNLEVDTIQWLGTAAATPTVAGVPEVDITHVGGTTTLTESYAADGAAPTLSQAIYMIMQALTEFAIAGTTITVKKLDGSTTAATFTLDSSTTPTSRTRAT